MTLGCSAVVRDVNKIWRLVRHQTFKCETRKMSRSPPSERVETLVRGDRRAEGCRRPSNQELASLLLTIIPACLKVLQGPLEAERGRHLSNLSLAPLPSSPTQRSHYAWCLSYHFPANMLWHTLGAIRENSSIDPGMGFFSSLAFLMHYAMELESGCEEPFHPAKCLIGVSSVSAAALSFFIPLCSSPLKSLPPFEAEWSDTN